MSYFIIETAIRKIGNRFDLVLIASWRSRQIQLYSQNMLVNNIKNDKPTILALKEIEKKILK